MVVKQDNYKHKKTIIARQFEFMTIRKKDIFFNPILCGDKYVQIGETDWLVFITGPMLIITFIDIWRMFVFFIQ